jgi:hypothetical protein
MTDFDFDEHRRAGQSVHAEEREAERESQRADQLRFWRWMCSVVAVFVVTAWFTL